MPVNLASLRKLETPSPSVLAGPLSEAHRVAVVIRLCAGAAFPSCVTPRTQLAPDLFTAEIAAAELLLLDADPAVRSIALSRPLLPP